MVETPAVETVNVCYLRAIFRIIVLILVVINIKLIKISIIKENFHYNSDQTGEALR